MLWILIITSVGWSSTLLSQSSSSAPQVIAYVFVQNRVIQPGEIAAQKLTRINYAFASVRAGRIALDFPTDAPNLAALVELRKQNPSLRVLISVGGWLGSGNFSDMALTKESRGVFINSTVDFVTHHKLDGVDIDWEYPGLVGAGNHFRPEDKQNYTLLLQELRSRFDREGKKHHRKFLISVATGGSSEFLANTEMAKVQEFVDTVNLMAYDYYEPASDPVTGHHAPLFTNPADPKKVSADRSVQEYERAGVSASKIVLGVPFYGHVWGAIPGDSHGLYQPGKAIPGAFAKYSDITSSMLNGDFTRYWDDAASAPYLYSAAKQIFVSYEDPESLALKCKYVLDHKLGGIMFWDYSGDPSGALLDAIQQGLHRQPAAARNTP